ncbi:hypothetical protein AVEN_132393-1 [Araneus ventricosus]|uniref:Uncharacterized protein n=1 Tax=Araneus ventricosus TaxID=182803 RepID=A0A4Y2JK46_ARAVE|nr:hypothetical protein AVEN_132393-1 [Araneus ventricosus]
MNTFFLPHHSVSQIPDCPSLPCQSGTSASTTSFSHTLAPPARESSYPMNTIFLPITVFLQQHYRSSSPVSSKFRQHLTSVLTLAPLRHVQQSCTPFSFLSLLHRQTGAPSYHVFLNTN